MELNMTTNRLRDFSLDEGDNFSNISHISCGLPNSLNSDSECSAPISVRDMIQHYNNQTKKEETNHINHKIKYKINNAKRLYHQHNSQHLLAATKSSYCGLNNYGSHLNTQQFVDQMEHKSSPPSDDHNHNAIICCKNCSQCLCCHNRNRINSITNKVMSSTSSSLLLQKNNENNEKPKSNISIRSSNSCNSNNNYTNCNKINAKDTLTHRILVVENCNRHRDDDDDEANASDVNAATTILSDFNEELNKDLCNGLFHNQPNNSQFVVAQQKQQQKTKNRLLSIDSVEEANICQETPIETSYQSKTTIAKTSSGVRIIIDIFFDQEQCANSNDIVGSRVETDIPQSHILSEFQQQAITGNIKATTANDTI